MITSAQISRTQMINWQEILGTGQEMKMHLSAQHGRSYVILDRFGKLMALNGVESSKPSRE